MSDSENSSENDETIDKIGESDYFERIKFEQPVKLNRHPVNVGNIQKTNKGEAAKKSNHTLRLDEYIEDYKTRKSRFQTLKGTLIKNVSSINTQCGREVIVFIKPPIHKQTSTPPLEINLMARNAYSMSKKLVDNTDQYNVGFKVNTGCRQRRDSDIILTPTKDRMRRQQRNETISTFNSPSRPRFLSQPPNRRIDSPSNTLGASSSLHNSDDHNTSPVIEMLALTTLPPQQKSSNLGVKRRVRTLPPKSLPPPRPPRTLPPKTPRTLPPKTPRTLLPQQTVWTLTPQQSAPCEEDLNPEIVSGQYTVSHNMLHPEDDQYSRDEMERQDEIRQDGVPDYQSGQAEEMDFRGDSLHSFSPPPRKTLAMTVEVDGASQSQVQEMSNQLSTSKLDTTSAEDLTSDSNYSSPLNLSSVCRPSVSSGSDKYISSNNSPQTKMRGVDGKTQYNSDRQKVDRVTKNITFKNVCSITEALQLNHANLPKKITPCETDPHQVIKITKEFIVEAPEFNQFKENVVPSNVNNNDYASLNSNKDVAVHIDKNLNTNDSINKTTEDDSNINCKDNTNPNLFKRQLSLQSSLQDPLPLKKRAFSTNNEFKKPTSWRNSIVPLEIPNVTINNLPHVKQTTANSPILDESKIGQFNCQICKAEEKGPQDRAYKKNKNGQFVLTGYKHTWITCETQVNDCTYWAHCSCLYEKGLISKEIKNKRDLEKLTFFCSKHLAEDLNLRENLI